MACTLVHGPAPGQESILWVQQAGLMRKMLSLTEDGGAVHFSAWSGTRTGIHFMGPASWTHALKCTPTGTPPQRLEEQMIRHPDKRLLQSAQKALEVRPLTCSVWVGGAVGKI